MLPDVQAGLELEVLEACQTTPTVAPAAPATAAYALFVWTHAPVLHAALLASTSLGRVLGPLVCPSEAAVRGAEQPEDAARAVAEGPRADQRVRAHDGARASHSKDGLTLRVNRFGVMVREP